MSILYGPTPQEDRHAIVEAFRDEPGPHVVLASEIAAEGLDFEFVNVMVNYDLPWNPMRVEQRIGRLDRYGQQADDDPHHQLLGRGHDRGADPRAALRRASASSRLRSAISSRSSVTRSSS